MASGRMVGIVEFGLARFSADRRRLDRDAVPEPVRRHILPQGAQSAGGGFRCDYSPPWQQCGQGQRSQADIRPDIHHHPIRRQYRRRDRLHGPDALRVPGCVLEIAILRIAGQHIPASGDRDPAGRPALPLLHPAFRGGPSRPG